MALSNTTLASFAALATPVDENVFEGSNKFAKLMAQAQTKAREDDAKAVVQELVTVARTMQDRRVQLHQTAQALRVQADEAIEASEQIDAAFAYGQEQDNYLPLLSILGMVSPKDYRSAGVSKAKWEELCSIPEGWTPKAPAEG